MNAIWLEDGSRVIYLTKRERLEILKFLRTNPIGETDEYILDAMISHLKD